MAQPTEGFHDRQRRRVARTFLERGAEVAAGVRQQLEAAALTGIVTRLQQAGAVTGALARHGIEGARAAVPAD